MKNKKTSIVLITLVLSAIFVTLGAVPAKAKSSTAYYNDDGAVVTITSCDLVVQIVKDRANLRAGARVSSITYDGKIALVSDVSSSFGAVTVLLSNGTSTSLYPNAGTLIAASGNNTGNLSLTFLCAGLTDFKGSFATAVNSTITYTFYADINTFFVSVFLESTQNSDLYQYSNYGSSLSFILFQSYKATATYNNSTITGKLVHDNSSPLNMRSYNILTLENIADHIAVTLFSTNFRSQLYGQIRDAATYTEMQIRNTSPMTWDTKWYESASYWGNGISYSCGWAFSKDGNPFLVTPWLMPNAAPFGMVWSLDDLPNGGDGYNQVPPDPKAQAMRNLNTWLSGNANRKVTILWVYDTKIGTMISTSGGLDGSWINHGNFRVANMSLTAKTYYDNLVDNQVQYGTHGYHHDYPWQHEFSAITNTTNLNSTWNQIYQDAQAFLGNKSLDFFKAAGYKARPQILNILPKYGIQQYDAGEDQASIPVINFFIDDVGNRLIISEDQAAFSDDVNNGVSSTTIYHDVINNASTFGLITAAGHWLNSPSNQATFNEIFDNVDNFFDGNFTYFYWNEINDYWIDVLWNNNYTFNTTQVSSSSSDPRLTYKLWNIPPTFTIDNVRSIDVGLALYLPNKSPPVIQIPEIPQSDLRISIIILAVSTTIIISIEKINPNHKCLKRNRTLKLES